MPLRKPWAVTTTCRALADALRRRCADAQPRHGDHGVTHGLSAKASAYYTPELVEVAGRAILSAVEQNVVAPLEEQESGDAAEDLRNEEQEDCQEEGREPRPAPLAVAPRRPRRRSTP